MTIVAALSVESPLLRNASERAMSERNKFISDEGDPFTLLNIYNEWIYIKSKTNENSRKWYVWMFGENVGVGVCYKEKYLTELSQFAKSKGVSEMV